MLSSIDRSFERMPRSWIARTDYVYLVDPEELHHHISLTREGGAIMLTKRPIKDGIVEALASARHAHRQALPKLALELKVKPIKDQDVLAEVPLDKSEEQSIAGFTCVIEYGEDMRLIVCRRFDLIGEDGYVGAVCHSARGYRQFRIDRIVGVYDAQTGEMLGDGHYFRRFAVDGHRERASTWGLPSSARYTLICGLNVLAFMSRCDGHWHPLETEVIEHFVCALWLRKGWEGDAPIEEILAHAERLAPDWETVSRALLHISQSGTSSRVLLHAVSDLIAADGIICATEHHWAQELVESLESFSEHPSF
jgi:hypothetical protein